MTRLRLPRLLFATVAILTIPSISGHALTVGEPDGIGPFVDADGTPHENSIAALWADSVTMGCEEWRFCPEDPVTRGEMAAFLTRAMNLKRSEDIDFVDTEDSPFGPAIRAIAAADVTHGCSEERFCPEDPVTRGQMASFLARALDLETAESSPFEDIGDNVHQEDIARIAAAGITSGCDPTRFCPDREVTRAEMAAFLARGLDLPTPENLPEIPQEVIDEYREETGEESNEPRAEDWRPLVERYFPASEVDRAIRVIDCESNGDPDAYNPSSGASGLFQHLPQYWAERSAAAGFGGSSIYDPEANVGVAAWLVYDYSAGGWHHWTCS